MSVGAAPCGLHLRRMANLVHIVRHAEVHNPGHVVYGRLPHYGLSELGHRQAADAARYLERQPIVAVWSSPLERALQTATTIAQRHDLPVLVSEEITEWKLADGWEGLAWDDLPATRPGQLEAYLEHPWDLPWARESLEVLGERMVTEIKAINDRHPEGDVVIVSHQDPVQIARLLLTGRPVTDQHTEKPQHASVFTYQPGWVEAARYDPDEQEDFPPS